MVQVAKKLVEAMHSRQIFVAIAEMILAELPGGVAERFEQLRQGNVSCLQTCSRAREADFAQAGAQRALASDER
jgi:hypothetical protein